MPEQQPHGQSGSPPLYMPYGASGGGGAGEQYVFANAEEIDSIIADLEAEVKEIHDDDRYYQQAIDLAMPPAEDLMSVGQVDTYGAALQKGWEHNKTVAVYAENQLAKLRAARQAYIDTDSGAAEQLRNVNEAGE